MKFMRNLLILTTLISALLSCGVLAADEATAGLLISPALTQESIESADVVYSDIPAGASYADSVYKLSAAGVFNGDDDGTWNPEGEVTRAEMAKMIILTFGLVGDQKKPAEFYPDVAETEWYYPYVLAIHNLGLVKGYENGEYRPKNNITRAEVCTILYRMFEDDGDKKKVLETSPFIPGMPDRKISDLPADPWANKYIQTIINNYLMPLEEGGTFRPKEPIKRYELADLLAKFVIEAPEILTADVRFFVGDEQWGETDIIAVGDAPSAPEEEPASTVQGEAFKGWKRRGADGTNVLDLSADIITEPGTVEYEAVFDKLWTVKFWNGDVVHKEIMVFNGERIPSAPEATECPGDSTTMEFFWGSKDGTRTDVIGRPVSNHLDYYAHWIELESNPNSEELLNTLDEAKSELADVFGATTTKKIQFLCVVLEEILNEIIASSKDKIEITGEYVQERYADHIVELKSYVFHNYDQDENGEPDGTILLNHKSREKYTKSTTGLSGDNVNEFYNLLLNKVSKDVQDFIIDYFDLQDELDKLKPQV